MRQDGVTQPGIIAHGVDQRFRWHQRLVKRPLPTVGKLAHGSARFSSLIGRPLSMHSVFRPTHVADARSVPDLPRVVGHPYLQLWRARTLTEERDATDRAAAERDVTERVVTERAAEEMRARSAGILPRVTRGVQDGFAPGSGLLRLQRDVLPVRLLPDVAAVGPVLTAREHTYAIREAQRRPRSSSVQQRRFRPPALTDFDIPRERPATGEAQRPGEQRRRDEQQRRDKEPALPQLSAVDVAHAPSVNAVDLAHAPSVQPPFAPDAQGRSEDGGVSPASGEVVNRSLETQDLPAEGGGSNGPDGSPRPTIDDQQPGLGLASAGAGAVEPPHGGGSGSGPTLARSPEDELLALSMLLLGGLGSSFLQVQAARDGAEHIDRVGPFWQYSSQFPRTSFARGADNLGVVGARLRIGASRTRREDNYRETGRAYSRLERTSAGRQRTGDSYPGTHEDRSVKDFIASAMRPWSPKPSGDQLRSPLAGSALGYPPSGTSTNPQAAGVVAAEVRSHPKGSSSSKHHLRDVRDSDGHESSQIVLHTPGATAGLHLGMRRLRTSAGLTPSVGAHPRFLQRLGTAGRGSRGQILRHSGFGTWLGGDSLTGPDLSGFGVLRGAPTIGDTGASDSRLTSGLRRIRPGSTSIARRLSEESKQSYARERNPMTEGMRRQTDFVEALGGRVSDAARPLPAALEPLAKALGITRPVKIRTGPSTASALSRAGRPAATYGGVIHLQRDPDLSPASVELVAHELVHAAEEPKSVASGPRFFRDDRLDSEESRARMVGSLAAGMVGESAMDTRGRRGAFTGIANLDRLPVIGRHRVPMAPVEPTRSAVEVGRGVPIPGQQPEDDSTKALRALFDRFRGADAGGSTTGGASSATAAMPPAPPFAAMNPAPSLPGSSQSVASWSPPLPAPMHAEPLSSKALPPRAVPPIPLVAHRSPLAGVVEPHGIRSTQGDHAVNYESHVVDSSSAPRAEEFLDWLVEQVERRVLREMEAQGRRHMPDVL